MRLRSPGRRWRRAVGGELMEMDVGRVEVGYLADLLLVDGEPTEDVGVLAEPANLKVIMIDGHVHRSSLGEGAQPAQPAARM